MRTGFSKKSDVRMWWLGGALGLLVLLVVARSTTSVLDPQTHRFVVRGLSYAMVGAACVWLTMRLKPRRPTWVEATADHNGVFVDGAPLVLRQDIEQAYIRPRIDARVLVSGMALQRIVVGLPDYPLTVEIIRHHGAQLNLDPGSEQAAAAMLTAMGIPVTMCPPDYGKNLKPKRSTAFLTVAIVVVFLAAFVGYYLYMVAKISH